MLYVSLNFFLGLGFWVGDVIYDIEIKDGIEYSGWESEISF